MKNDSTGRHTNVPYRKIALGPRDVDVVLEPGGVIRMKSRHALGSYPDKLSDRFTEVARRHPDRVFLAMRDERSQWRTITYREAEEQILRLASALIRRNVSPERPVAILSGSSIEHALLAFAAMYTGVPYCSVTPAYSLLSTDHAKLRHIINLLTPGLVYADDGSAFEAAIRNTVPADVEVVTLRSPLTTRASTPFSELLATPIDPAIYRANREVGPDTIAKVLFTSGSTGFPKGVINTQRMLCSNQQMFIESLPAFAQPHPMIVSWLPWHHTSGGNQMLGLTAYCGASFYIDEGKPTRSEIGKTVANLMDVAPTVYFSLPRGFAELIPYLRENRQLREKFFSQLQLFYYSGASLPESLVADLDEIAVATVGERIPMMCGYGSTETAPFALCANWLTSETGLAGLPVPGAELKLVPQGDKLEARLRGPMVTPGYWRQPELTARLFDEEGYVRMGDALAFVDPNDVSRGLAFDGRLSEDFKLSTGTWVNVASLRNQWMTEGYPLVQDIIIAGENRDEIGGLIVLDVQGCQDFLHDRTLVQPAQLARHPEIRRAVRNLLNRLAARNTGSSTYVARAIILEEPPSNATGELTDKGSINQRAVIRNRAELVDALYAPDPGPDVFLPE